MRQKAFRGIIPEKDFREKMIPGLNSYDPAGEVAMLLLRDGNPHTFLPGFASTAHTPRELHEAVTSEPEMHQKPN
jgi:hypothetical protein